MKASFGARTAFDKFVSAGVHIHKARMECGQARSSATFQNFDSPVGGWKLHRTLTGTAKGAVGRTIICMRSGPTDTYDTGTPTKFSIMLTYSRAL